MLYLQNMSCHDQWLFCLLTLLSSHAIRCRISFVLKTNKQKILECIIFMQRYRQMLYSPRWYWISVEAQLHGFIDLKNIGELKETGTGFLTRSLRPTSDPYFPAVPSLRSWAALSLFQKSCRSTNKAHTTAMLY